MFGYVRPPAQDLPEGELNRFRTMYCGLCHTLSRRYGQAARMVLNYDFTYLAILLSDGTAGRGKRGAVLGQPGEEAPLSGADGRHGAGGGRERDSGLLAAAGRRGGSHLGCQA